MSKLTTWLAATAFAVIFLGAQALDVPSEQALEEATAAAVRDLADREPTPAELLQQYEGGVRNAR